MDTYSVSSPAVKTYEEGLKVVESLQKAGVNAHVTSGGIAIDPENEEQVKKIQEVLESYNLKAHEGWTDHQENVMNPEFKRG